MKMIRYFKDRMSKNSKIKLLYKFRGIKAFFFITNLTRLAQIHKTDKFGDHNYTLHYQRHFKPYQYKKINLLEIGVGGYDDPKIGGNSLRMWKSYFPFSKIYSLDIYDKSFLQENRIKIFKGSQIDKELLINICKKVDSLDIIIDDGSHINEHVITTFEILFPKLKKGGIYVVEDTQTSYWKNFGGTSKEFNKNDTIYGYFKALIDGLNSEEYLIENYKKTYYDKHITSMHFYHNLIFIYKGDNDEKSKFVENNKLKSTNLSDDNG